MKKYVLHWWYFDGSGRGVLPGLYNEAQVEMIKAVLKEVGDLSTKEWTFVEVSEPSGV